MPDTKNTPIGTIRVSQGYLTKGDLEGAMSVIHEDQVFVDQGGKQIRGMAEIKKRAEANIKTKPTFAVGRFTEVIAGDIAALTYEWTMNCGACPDEKGEKKGVSYAVLKKQTDGTWKILILDPYGQTHLNEMNAGVANLTIKDNKDTTPSKTNIAGQPTENTSKTNLGSQK